MTITLETGAGIVTDDERDAAIQDMKQALDDMHRLLQAVAANTQAIPAIKAQQADFEAQLEATGSELAKMMHEDTNLIRADISRELGKQYSGLSRQVSGVDRNVNALNSTVAGHVSDDTRHVA